MINDSTENMYDTNCNLRHPLLFISYNNIADNDKNILKLIILYFFAIHYLNVLHLKKYEK